jgi:hypothetical protein
MKSPVKALLLLSIFGAAWCGAADPAVGFRCDFKTKNEVEGWEILGAKGAANKTQFFLAEEPGADDKRILVVEAKNASGFLVFKIKGLTLKKYPYMRWRWRVVRKMNLAADKPEPDDQVCVIYIVDGSKITQKCVGYRWEHNTKVGKKRMIKYFTNKVMAICLRNRETPAGEWVIEERNVFEDYKKAFRKEPSDDFVITIGGNSQHSNSDTRAEIDYIEFRSAPTPAK